MHTFNTPGTHTYRSSVNIDMMGTVIVQQPVPEFPGFVAPATIGLAAFVATLEKRSTASVPSSRTIQGFRR